MTHLPTVYTIQASDATQYTSKLQEILQNLKTEDRIEGFTTLGADVDLSSLTDKVQDQDLILLLLTTQLESRKEQIENGLKTLRTKQPGIRVVEIIVDHVPYENAFITFPADLRPVREREDMHAVWSGIEQSLKDMFPVRKTPEPAPKPAPAIDWPKYLKIAGILIALILAFFLVRGLLDRDDRGYQDQADPPKAKSQYEEDSRY